MKAHELAIEAIQSKINSINTERREVISLRQETVEEEKAATYEPKKSVLASVASTLWDREVTLSREALNLALSLRVLEDAQESALAQ